MPDTGDSLANTSLKTLPIFTYICVISGYLSVFVKHALIAHSRNGLGGDCCIRSNISRNLSTKSSHNDTTIRFILYRWFIEKNILGCLLCPHIIHHIAVNYVNRVTHKRVKYVVFLWIFWLEFGKFGFELLVLFFEQFLRFCEHLVSF